MPWMPTTDQAWKLAPQLPLPLATQAKQPQYVFNWMPWINWNCHESTPHHLLLSTSMSNLMKVTTSSISSECRNCTHEIKGALGEPIAFLPQSNHEPINFNGETSQKKKLVNPPGPIQWQPQMLGSQTARDHRAKPTLKKQSQQPVRYKMEWSTKRWKKGNWIWKNWKTFNFMCELQLHVWVYVSAYYRLYKHKNTKS